MMDIEKLKKRCGYDGKPQQWQYGFDLACRELTKDQSVPEGFVLVPREPTEEMIQAGRDERRDLGAVASTYKAMIEAQEKNQ